jgi:hypothetical protein
MINFPAEPEIDDIYTFGDRAWKWNGEGWEAAAASSGPVVTVSSTEPSTPNEGDLWWDTTDGILKVYVGTAWTVTSTYT